MGVGTNADRHGIGRVAHSAPHLALHAPKRYDLHVIPHGDQYSRPVMPRRTGLDNDQARRQLLVERRLSIAVILDGGSRTDAERSGAFGLQVILDWVLRFNKGGPVAPARSCRGAVS